MKSKFNKKKCEQCKYHGYFGSKSQNAYSSNEAALNHVMCEYAKCNKTTCLRLVGKELVDLRGSDYNNCKLFEKGKRQSDQNF